MKRDLRGIGFEEFLEYAFDPARDGDSAAVEVDAAAQLAHAERLFREPEAARRFPRPRQEVGFWFLPGETQPAFLSAQLWNHALPSGARISCVNAMEILYRDLFARDPLGEDAFMWFDRLRDAAPRSCKECEPVRRALVGALEAILQHDPRAALHGLHHWARQREREAIVDPWLERARPEGELRDFALRCRDGKYM